MKIRPGWKILFAAALAALAAGLLFSRPPRTAHSPAEELGEGRYRFGKVEADTLSGEISFPARVRVDRGPVRYLLNLEGYLWLDEESALVSPARLLDLQQALALLDWEFWEDYRMAVLEERPPPAGPFTLRLAREGDRDDREIPGKGGVAGLLFLGSPYFDGLVLAASPGDCLACPLYPLEREAVERLQERAGLTGGFTLPEDLLPSPESELTVIITRNDPGEEAGE